MSARRDERQTVAIEDLVGGADVRLLLPADLLAEERQGPVGGQRPALGEKEDVDRAVEEDVGDGEAERPVDALVERPLLSSEQGESRFLACLRARGRPGGSVVAVHEVDGVGLTDTLRVLRGQLVVDDDEQPALGARVVGWSVVRVGNPGEQDGLNGRQAYQQLRHLGRDLLDHLLFLDVHDTSLSRCLVCEHVSMC